MPLVATLGSHSALQILKGAHDEGLANLVVATRRSARLYRRYEFVDEVVELNDYGEFGAFQAELARRDAVIVPHGSFVAYLGAEANLAMLPASYGPRRVLQWEGDRDLQRRWLTHAAIPQPREFATPEAIDSWPVLVKRHGAAGGKGYFLARSRAALDSQLAALGDEPVTIQEYVIGVTLYVHYFQSVIDNRLEILSMDRRYETNADGLGRLPHGTQMALSELDRLAPSYVVVGNSPLVLRESMLETAYEMGERVVDAARELIDPRGLWGPFCLETIITPDLAFHIIEISCRIVAGTNLFVDGSPYAALFFDEPMSTGRRISRELRLAAEAGRLEELLDRGDRSVAA